MSKNSTLTASTKKGGDKTTYVRRNVSSMDFGSVISDPSDQISAIFLAKSDRYFTDRLRCFIDSPMSLKKRNSSSITFYSMS